MYEKNGKIYLDENEYRREGYIMESESSTKRKNRNTALTAVILLLLMFLIPTLLLMHDFRKNHLRQNEAFQILTEVTSCTSN